MDFSSSCTNSTGAPQECVLSPTTQMTTSTDPSVKLLKCADDTTVIGLIQDGIQKIDTAVYLVQSQQLGVEHTQTSGDGSRLEEEHPSTPPLIIMNSTVAAVKFFKFLGRVAPAIRNFSLKLERKVPTKGLVNTS